MFRPKFSTGDICALDPENVLKQPKSGCDTVIIDHCVNPYSIFREKKYVVYPNTNNSLEAMSFIAPEHLLTNANKMVIRYPDNIPILNDAEIEALGYIVVTCKDTVPESIMRRIIALKDKLDYYNKNDITVEECI